MKEKEEEEMKFAVSSLSLAGINSLIDFSRQLEAASPDPIAGHSFRENAV